MITLKVDLPNPVLDYIHSLNRDENVFAKEAIEEKIVREKRQHMESLLKEGYQSTANEDLAISNDFIHADSGNL